MQNGKFFAHTDVDALEHSHPKILSHPILPSQKVILSIIPYPFYNTLSIPTFILQYNTLK